VTPQAESVEPPKNTEPLKFASADPDTIIPDAAPPAPAPPAPAKPLASRGIDLPIVAAPAPEPTTSADTAETPEPAAPIVTALPPVRPKIIPKPVKPLVAAQDVDPVAAAKPAPVKVASAEPVAPVAAPAPAAGGFVVQVSSQKSQADAMSAWQTFQRKFSAVVGGLKPSIKKAEVGGRGTFYRVRVGPWASSTEATALCVKLKAAGGDCVVARN
jgi:cell division protein FtsN